MNGLDTLNKLMDPDARVQLEAELLEKRRRRPRRGRRRRPAPETEQRSARISLDVPILAVPDASRHMFEVGGVPHTMTWPLADGGSFSERVNLDAIWSYINPQMLFGRHLGFRGRFSEALEAGEVKALELAETIEAVKAECRAGAMTVRGVWQFFEAEPDGNKIHIFEAGEAVPLRDVRVPPPAQGRRPRAQRPRAAARARLSRAAL